MRSTEIMMRSVTRSCLLHRSYNITLSNAIVKVASNNSKRHLLEAALLLMNGFKGKFVHF